MLAAQRDDATPAVLVAHALVEREQARVEAGDGVRAPPRDLRGLGNCGRVVLEQRATGDWALAAYNLGG